MQLMTRMGTWLLPILLCASCYQVKIASGTFTCKEPGDRCPDGQLCSGGLCVNPGDERDLGSEQDQRGPLDTDLSVEGDLRSGPAPDLTTAPDLTIDPCVSWTEISANKIYACRRTFTVTGGNFDNLCRAGYHVCNGADDVSAAGGGGAAARCANVANGAFFTTAIDIALRNLRENQRTADGVCMPGAGDMSRALLGCGFTGGLYVLNGGNTCNGMNIAMRCSMALSGWTCSSAKEITQSSTQGGVLCCAN